MNIVDPLSYIEKFATLGSVSVEKTKVTFTASEGEGDDKFVFTLVGNKATLAESVGEIVKYLIKASNLVDSVLGELPGQALGTPETIGNITKFPSEAGESEDHYARPSDPVYNRNDFLNDPEFKPVHEGGIDFKPIVSLPFKAQDQTFSMGNYPSKNEPQGLAFEVKSDPKASQ